MASKLRIPSPLRRFTDGESSIAVNGDNVRQILEELFRAHPDIKGHLVEDDGRLRNFVNIFIAGEDIRQKGGMDAEVADGSDVRIIPSIAGGSVNLSPEEFIRYSRHLSLPEVGIVGQKKNKISENTGDWGRRTWKSCFIIFSCCWRWNSRYGGL